MKNIELEVSRDELRPEYEKTDFSHWSRGAVTQVEFTDRVALFLASIGEEQGVRFEQHSTGNYLAQPAQGDWTYEIDNGNQITLRYWLGGWDNIHEPLSNPPCIVTPEDNAQLRNALTEGFRSLKVKAENVS